MKIMWTINKPGELSFWEWRSEYPAVPRIGDELICDLDGEESPIITVDQVIWQIDDDRQDDAWVYATITGEK